MDHFNIKDVKGVTAPTVRDSEIQSGRQATEGFVHCECALAVEMRKVTSESLEIGVSKECCWACFQFLKEYSDKTGGICLTASHGKCYQGWLFPLEKTHSLYQRMEDAAREEFRSLLGTLNRRRKLDSYAAWLDDDDDDDYDQTVEALTQSILAMD